MLTSLITFSEKLTGEVGLRGEADLNSKAADLIFPKDKWLHHRPPINTQADVAGLRKFSHIHAHKYGPRGWKSKVATTAPSSGQ